MKYSAVYYLSLVLVLLGGMDVHAQDSDSSVLENP